MENFLHLYLAISAQCVSGSPLYNITCAKSNLSMRLWKSRKDFYKSSSISQVYTLQAAKFFKLQSTARTEICIIVTYRIELYRGYLENAFFSQSYIRIKVE